MARFEIVGLSDCPWFAKACKLADEISGLYPKIEFHREMMENFHWNDFRDKMKRQRGWEIKRSPVVYEVLIDPNGKAVLIGDCNDFCEFSAMYFEIYYDPSSATLLELAMANKLKFGKGFEGMEWIGDSSIFNVSIVNAPIPLLELLLTQLLSPVAMIPSGCLLNIQIYDEFSDPSLMNGVLMEVTDLASPVLFKIGLNSTLTLCFYQCQLLILAEDFSRGLTEDGKDWITRVELKVAQYIMAINDERNKMEDCRILVGGDGPQCYIAEMMRKAISLSCCGLGRIVATGQYIAQRAKCELGKIGDIPAGCVSRIHAWGWPGETGAYIEVKDAVVKGADISIQGPGVEIPLSELATNSDYIFIKFSKEFLRLQKKSLAYTFPQPKRYMALAESIVNTLHIWFSCEQLRTFSKDEEEEGGGEPFERVASYSSMPEACESGEPAIPILPSKGALPVLNVGVACPSASTFPEGTFMVQPSVCVNGSWEAIGLISEKTNAKVVEEVNKLWLQREELIYRDRVISTLFPDFEELVRSEEQNDPTTRISHAGLVLKKADEVPGEGENNPTTPIME